MSPSERAKEDREIATARSISAAVAAVAVAAALALATFGPPVMSMVVGQSDPGRWTNVVTDRFDALSSIPAHWQVYNGLYGSLPGNCASSSHAFVGQGELHLLMSYESAGGCGAGWYTAGMKLDPAFAAVDQRVTVRFRVVDQGVAGHDIIPMRWPTDTPWPAGGEEDFCERDPIGECSTFLHYGSLPATAVSHGLPLDLSQWHTVRAQRRGLTVTLWVDDLTHPVWSYVGDPSTLPETNKTVVLQQECIVSGCPSTTSGFEDIQVAWIVVDVPAAD